MTKDNENIGEIIYEAMEYLKNGNYKKSIIYFEKVLALDSDNITAWVMMGQSYENLKNLSQAIDCYDKALAINPRHEDAKWFKANLLLKKISTDNVERNNLGPINRSVSSLTMKNKENSTYNYKKIQCVRCGSKDNINRYFHITSDIVKHVRTRHYSSTTRYHGSGGSGYFPVCSLCLKIFSRWKLIRRLTLALFCIPSFILALIVMMLGFEAMVHAGTEASYTGSYTYSIQKSSTQAILIPTVIIWVVLGIFLLYMRDVSKTKPKNVMIVRYGKVWVKPKGVSKWMPIEEWTSNLPYKGTAQTDITKPSELINKLYSIDNYKNVIRKEPTIRELEMKSQVEKLQTEGCPFCLSSFYQGRKECSNCGRKL